MIKTNAKYLLDYLLDLYLLSERKRFIMAKILANKKY
jgi:hypothetical protein